jgi:hypothetical protein
MSKPRGRPKGTTGIHPKGQCKICQHPQRADIEMDYIHYIPMKVIEQRYNIFQQNLDPHARAYNLREKRDRKSFYNYIMDHYTISKITAENALEAAKQLDRIERVIQDNPQPTNIVVNYSWGKALERPTAKDTNRLPTLADAGEIPPLSKEI